MKKEKNFILFCHFRLWLRYTRRPHFAPFRNYFNLYVIEDPLVIFSKEFIKNPIKNTYSFITYSFKIRNDYDKTIRIIRPVQLFSHKQKNKSNLLAQIDLFFLKLKLKKIINFKLENIICLTDLKQRWLLKWNIKSFRYYDMNDEWSMIKYNGNASTIETIIRKSFTNVNLVTAVTKKLRDKYNVNKNCYFFPNGVNINHYKPEFDNEFDKENEVYSLNIVSKEMLKKEENDPRKYLKDIDGYFEKNKIYVGAYSGLSGNWSDFDFVREVEQLLPKEINLISSGNIHPPTHPNFFEEYKMYIKKQRMKFLGYVDYSVLPKFLEHLKCGLVFHRMDEFNKHSAPNKIWAYLAMGLPVVSTNFLFDYDKEVYEGLVRFCDNPEDYVKAIIEEVENDSLDKRILRRKLAVKNSTDNRAKKISNLIYELIDENISN